MGGACRYGRGIYKVLSLIPTTGKKSLQEISSEILKNIQIVYVDNMDEVIERAFVKE